MIPSVDFKRSQGPLDELSVPVVQKLCSTSCTPHNVKLTLVTYYAIFASILCFLLYRAQSSVLNKGIIVKSDIVKKGIERAPHRSLLRAVGCSSGDWDKPFIGVINSFSEVVPGHIHLQTIARGKGGDPKWRGSAFRG